MIMQQTLFIVILAVAIAFVLTYRWKKKAENKMDNMSLKYKSKQQIFFLTKADIVKMMTVVERKIPIKYTLFGAFKQETIRRENTISKMSQWQVNDIIPRRYSLTVSADRHRSPWVGTGIHRWARVGKKTDALPGGVRLHICSRSPSRAHAKLLSAAGVLRLNRSYRANLLDAIALIINYLDFHTGWLFTGWYVC